MKETELGIACDLGYKAYLAHGHKIVLVKQVRSLFPEIQLMRVKFFVDGYLYAKEATK